MAADRQTARHGFLVADREWNHGRRHIFVSELVWDAGDNWRVIYPVDREQKTRAGSVPVTVGHCNGDRGRAELIDQWCDDYGPVCPGSIEEDLVVRHQG